MRIKILRGWIAPALGIANVISIRSFFGDAEMVLVWSLSSDLSDTSGELDSLFPYQA
jgi:hypothetical protein